MSNIKIDILTKLKPAIIFLIFNVNVSFQSFIVLWTLALKKKTAKTSSFKNCIKFILTSSLTYTANVVLLIVLNYNEKTKVLKDK